MTPGTSHWCLLITLIIGVNLVAADPCLTYKEFQVDYKRSPGHVEPVYENSLCDILVREKWYRFVGEAGGDLTNDKESLITNSCGTVYPLWMNGDIPDVAEGIVDRSVCIKTVFASCHRSFTIQVKNCCSYRVYNLHSASMCPSSYCISQYNITNDNCTTPSLPTTTMTTTMTSLTSTSGTTPSPTTTVGPKTPSPTTTVGPKSPSPTTTVGPKSPSPTTTVGPITPSPTTTVGPKTPSPTTTVGPKTPSPTTTVGPKTPSPTTTIGPKTPSPTTTVGPKTPSPTVSPSSGKIQTTSRQTPVDPVNDPCLTYKEFQVDYKRSPSHVEPVYENSLCDILVREKWYRFVGEAGGDLTNNKESLITNGCGTVNPLWMKGEIPDVAEGIVDRSVCIKSVFSSCHRSFTIQVKNCCSYRVYYLRSPSFCPSSYCISQYNISTDHCTTPTLPTTEVRTTTAGPTTPPPSVATSSEPRQQTTRDTVSDDGIHREIIGNDSNGYVIPVVTVSVVALGILILLAIGLLTRFSPHVTPKWRSGKYQLQ